MPRRTRRTPSQEPPFEPGINQWQSITRSFEEAVFLAVPKNERLKWLNDPQLSDFYVFSCGYFKKAWGHQWERKDLAEGVFIYCVSGKGWYTHKDKTWAVSPGDSLYCFPMTHHGYGADPEDPWSLYWMHISGPALSKYERLLNLSQEEPVIHMGLRTEIINLFRSLLRGFHPVPNESEWLASTVCAQHILARTAITPRQPPAAAQHTTSIQALMEYMETCATSNLDLGHFAAYADLSSSHLCKVFKQITGHTPIDYFNRLKMRQACSLLSTSRLTIQQIARHLGFEDPYYFSRLFKKVLGLSPNHYRGSIQGTPIEEK